MNIDPVPTCGYCFPKEPHHPVWFLNPLELPYLFPSELTRNMNELVHVTQDGSFASRVPFPVQETYNLSRRIEVCLKNQILNQTWGSLCCLQMQNPKSGHEAGLRSPGGTVRGPCRTWLFKGNPRDPFKKEKWTWFQFRRGFRRKDFGYGLAGQLGVVNSPGHFGCCGATIHRCTRCHTEGRSKRPAVGDVLLLSANRCTMHSLEFGEPGKSTFCRARACHSAGLLKATWCAIEGLSMPSTHGSEVAR